MSLLHYNVGKKDKYLPSIECEFWPICKILTEHQLQRIVMPTDGNYWITDNIQKQFLENPRFCSTLQDSIRKIFSVEIEINFANDPANSWNENKSQAHGIRLVETHKQQAVFDFISQYLKKIQRRKYSNTAGNDTHVEHAFDFRCS